MQGVEHGGKWFAGNDAQRGRSNERRPDAAGDTVVTRPNHDHIPISRKKYL
jgi:hypothetical protein